MLDSTSKGSSGLLGFPAHNCSAALVVTVMDICLAQYPCRCGFCPREHFISSGVVVCMSATFAHTFLSIQECILKLLTQPATFIFVVRTVGLETRIRAQPTEGLAETPGLEPKVPRVVLVAGEEALQHQSIEEPA